MYNSTAARQKQALLSGIILLKSGIFLITGQYEALQRVQGLHALAQDNWTLPGTLPLIPDGSRLAWAVQLADIGLYDAA